MRDPSVIVRAYETRRKRLVRWLEHEALDGMRWEYERAIDLTDAALLTFVRLSEAAADEAEAYREMREWVNDYLGRRAARLALLAEELAARAQTGGHDPALQGDISHAQIMLDGAAHQAEQFTQMDAARQVQVGVVPGLQRVLFEDALKPGIKGFKKKALIDGVKLAIQSTPAAGTFIGLGSYVATLGNLSEEDAKATRRHNEGLRDYRLALEFWCSVAETTIEKLDAAAASYE